jgi:serine/threonine protein kinase
MPKILGYTYEEKDLLGKGAFGNVYKGYLNRTEAVAIKIQNKINLQQLGGLQLVTEEIRVLKFLNSENIVKIYDSFEYE